MASITADIQRGTVPVSLECSKCGLIQHGPGCGRNELVLCCRCDSPLIHRSAKNFDLALACAAGTLLLLIPAMSAPFLSTTAFGASRTSILPLSAVFLWREGRPLLAFMVALFILCFPIIRFSSLTVVLLSIRLGRRPRWLGIVFRITNLLQTWTMLDVFLLGLLVAFARLRASIEVTLDAGGMCFVAAALLSLLTRATLDKAAVWELIAANRVVMPTRSMVMCLSCDLLLPQNHEGLRCPRCTAVVWRRRPENLARAAALLAAAFLLYFPANLYPIATIPIDLTPTAYTVLGGVVDLVKSHLLGLALLVFCASFTIPILKIAGLSWCLVSVLRHSTRRLIGKTRVYRWLDEIGRWSMVDPLTISCFVPVMHFNGLIDGRAEVAATPFAAVVILTTLAVKAFDPRRMWDAALPTT